MFDDDKSNFHTIGCLISRGCKISSFLTSSTSLFQSVCFKVCFLGGWRVVFESENLVVFLG